MDRFTYMKKRWIKTALFFVALYMGLMWGTTAYAESVEGSISYGVKDAGKVYYSMDTEAGTLTVTKVEPDYGMFATDLSFLSNHFLSDFGKEYKVIFGENCCQGIQLKKIKLPDNLTTIKKGAFSNISWLEVIEIPEQCTRIETGAFEGCISLDTMVFDNPDMILEESSIPKTENLKFFCENGVKSTSPSSYASTNGIPCQGNLSTVALTKDKYTYSSNSNTVLTAEGHQVKISTTTDSNGQKMITVLEAEIDWPVLEDDTLRNLTVDLTGLEELGGQIYLGTALFLSKGVYTVYLPSNIRRIGTDAFAYTGLERCSLPEGLESIGSGAFKSTLLSTIQIPASCIRIDDGGSGSVDNLDTNDQNYSTWGAFYYCTELTSVTFADRRDTDIDLGEFTFLKCSNLETIVLPDSITTIPRGLFAFCDRGLKGIRIPASCKEIESCAFYHCESLASCELPEGLEKIGYWTFVNTKLQAITIPASCTYIEGSESELYRQYHTKNSAGAFAGCSELETVIFAERPQEQKITLGEAAFWGCGSLQQIALPASCNQLASNTFALCSALIKVELPANVDLTIAESAIPNNENMTIVIPEIITDISNYHFETLTNVVFQITVNCSPTIINYINVNGMLYKEGEEGAIKKGTVEEKTPEEPADTEQAGKTEEPETTEAPQTVKELPEKGKTYVVKNMYYKVTGTKTATFMKPKNKKITTLTIPAKVTILGKSFNVTKVNAKACNQYKKLSKVTIGSNVTEIGAQAFANCPKLRNITFGKNVTKIGKQTLYKDKALTKIVFAGKKVKSIGKGTFKGVPRKVTIKAPKQVAKKYQKLINKT